MIFPVPLDSTYERVLHTLLYCKYDVDLVCVFIAQLLSIASDIMIPFFKVSHCVTYIFSQCLHL